MLNVNSEIGTLKKVIIHRPDEGIARISPKKAEELLFDDIVHLPQMREEHDIFRRVLQHILGKENVLDTQRLIEEGFEASPDVKEELIDKIVDYEELPPTDKDFFMSLGASALTKLLITGYYQDEDHIYFDPMGLDQPSSIGRIVLLALRGSGASWHLSATASSRLWFGDDARGKD